MDANNRALVRSAETADATADRRRAEAETVWSALRADRQSRDERTARLRAMALAVGADLTA
jgi:hypothetical protein